MKIPIFEFDLETEKLGTVKVNRLTVGAISEITKKLPDYKIRPGREVVLASLPALCKTEDNSAVNATHLSETELMRLAEKYLENNPKVMDCVGEPIVIAELKEGENSVEYLGRVLAYEIGSFNDSMAKVFKESRVVNAFKEINRLSDMVRENSALSSISSIHSATDGLSSILKDVERFKVFNSPGMAAYEDLRQQHELCDSVIPKFLLEEQKTQEMIKGIMGPEKTWGKLNSVPPLPKFNLVDVVVPVVQNPVHKTNEKLDDLTERLDAFTEKLADHLTTSAVTLQEMTTQIKTSSKGTWKQNWVAIAIAALSFIVALASFFKDSFKSTVVKKPQPTAVTAPVVKPNSVPVSFAAPKK